MQNKITVVISIRNRDTVRMKNQIASIRKTGANPLFHIVDYGSHESYAKEYKLLCNKLKLEYTHMYAEGLPWNKCRALNYGAKNAKTPFIVTSDVDMIYEGNPFQYCLDNYREKTMYHMETYWLPRNGNKKKARYAGHGNSGGFQFIAKSAFEKIGGYDERIVYWGPEDLDFPDRLKKIGYTQEWLPDTFKLYHQWHPITYSDCLRPYSATVNTLKYTWENKLNPIRKNDWGKKLTETERPILQEIRQNKAKAHILELKHGELDFWKSAYKVPDTKKYGFVKIELGKRINTRLFPRLKGAAKMFLKPAVSFWAINLPINRNFDVLYEMLPMFFANGLIDFFIEDDISSVYLLWN